MTIAWLREFLTQHLQDSIFAGNTYIVGGAVRDYLLGVEDIFDFDLCVELPEGGIKLGKYLAAHNIIDRQRVNQRFANMHLDFGYMVMDITATRKDRYKKRSRYPIVSFAKLPEDAYRRDFTINALYMEVFDGEIIDPSGMGLIDLQKKLIRTLRDPIAVLCEDPLRILRAIRFAAVLDFKIDDELDQAIYSHANLVKNISSQRRIVERNLMLGPDSQARAKKLLNRYRL